MTAPARRSLKKNKIKERYFLLHRHMLSEDVSPAAVCAPTGSERYTECVLCEKKHREECVLYREHIL
jgi:hypothetical protein